MKHKTTKQLEAESKTSFQVRKEQSARELLYSIQGMREQLAHIPGRFATAVRKDLDDRLEWLSKEDEVFQELMAEFWVERQTQGPSGGAAVNSCRVERD